MDIIAFFSLRIILAWMFLYPLKNLLADWEGTKNLVGLLSPIGKNFIAILMILAMIIGAISILFGIYAQIGSAILFVYSLIGAYIHYKLAKEASKKELSDSANKIDKEILIETKSLGIVGNVTSAQKNFVIAGALLFITLMGSGPYSITANIF